MRRKQKVRLYLSIASWLILAFFIGYFSSVITMVSWDVFANKPIISWFKQQNAIFLSEDNVDVENIEAYNKVKSVLEKNYYKEVDFNEAFSTSIKGLAAGLDDPYTVYFDPEEMRDYLEGVSGNYVGIGISVHMDENLLLNVADVFTDSPAKNMGLLKNDKIVKVDNEDITGITEADLIVKKIKGPANTKVRIQVYRPSINDYLDFEIERQFINISWIYSEIIDDDIGYIYIKQFDDDIAQDFETHLDELMDQGIKGLVIDLRDNPGGAYYQVVRIADRIVPQGVIVYTEDRQQNRNEQYSDGRELEIPLAILINGYSASASEILAACVQDYSKGVLVGTQTYGKGLVQEIDLDFANGGGLKYTKARYFTPSGESIHGKGVTPDIDIELSEEFMNTSIEDIPHEKDNQLQSAIRELEKTIEK